MDADYNGQTHLEVFDGRHALYRMADGNPWPWAQPVPPEKPTPAPQYLIADRGRELVPYRRGKQRSKYTRKKKSRKSHSR